MTDMRSSISDAPTPIRSPWRAATVILAVVTTVAGCGGDADGPADRRVSATVTGSGEQALLADPDFIDGARDIGVPVDASDPEAVGRRLGTRMRELTFDLGRVAPDDLRPGPYRDALIAAGALTPAAFAARHDMAPVVACGRLGRVIAHLDVRIDEAAKPTSTIVDGVVDGFGDLDRPPRPANRIMSIQQHIGDHIPAGNGLQCLTPYLSGIRTVSTTHPPTVRR